MEGADGFLGRGDGALMRALTYIQPIGWSIAYGHKPFENRVRDMRPREMRGVRTEVAIHNGAKWSEEYELLVRRLTGVVPMAQPMAVIGVAMFTGRVFTLLDPPPRDAEGRDWFVGPYAFEIDTSASIVLPAPIPCRGKQGFWTLHGDVEAQVRQQMARAA